MLTPHFQVLGTKICPSYLFSPCLPGLLIPFCAVTPPPFCAPWCCLRARIVRGKLVGVLESPNTTSCFLGPGFSPDSCAYRARMLVCWQWARVLLLLLLAGEVRVCPTCACARGRDRVRRTSDILPMTDWAVLSSCALHVRYHRACPKIACSFRSGGLADWFCTGRRGSPINPFSQFW